MTWIVYLIAFLAGSVFCIVVGIIESNKYYGGVKRNKFGFPRIWKGWK